MDHTSRVSDSGAESSPPTQGQNPSSYGAWLAAMIASVAFLVPGGIAFVYFGASFYRYIQ